MDQNKKKRVIEISTIERNTKEYTLAFVQAVERDADRDFVVTFNGIPLTGRQRRNLRRELIKQNYRMNKIRLNKILK